MDAVEDFWDDEWWKFTALHSAADNGDVEIVKMLIHSHCEVNAVENKFEIPPLHMAANKGHAEVVKILIQNGAVVNAVCQSEWNALELAASWGQVEVGKILISNGAIDLESPLYYAACNHEVAFTLQLSASVQRSIIDISKTTRQNYFDRSKIESNHFEPAMA